MWTGPVFLPMTPLKRVARLARGTYSNLKIPSTPLYIPHSPRFVRALYNLIASQELAKTAASQHSEALSILFLFVVTNTELLVSPYSSIALS